MGFVTGDQHVITALMNLGAGLEALNLLPQCDVVIQAQEVISTAMEVLIDYCDKRDISEDELFDMTQCAEQIKKDLRKIYATHKG